MSEFLAKFKESTEILQGEYIVVDSEDFEDVTGCAYCEWFGGRAKMLLSKGEYEAIIEHLETYEEEA